jgi:diadenosine tetraphosphate (Ap4A) HIT family hydrolase
VSSCVFCAIAAGEKTDQPIVAADEHTVAFLDVHPVFKGHVLVIPCLHYPTLADLPPELTGPLFNRVRQLSTAMAAAPGTDGSFIGVNNTVTESVPHLHVHVIPRTHPDGQDVPCAGRLVACHTHPAQTPMSRSACMAGRAPGYRSLSPNVSGCPASARRARSSSRLNPGRKYWNASP